MLEKRETNIHSRCVDCGCGTDVRHTACHKQPKGLRAHQRDHHPFGPAFMNLFDLTRSLMNIPSASGEEQVVGFFIRDHLESLGWTVELQPVEECGNNVIAHLNDKPRVFLSTHMDTVPPFISPTEDDEKICGRGSCDAKGIIDAQITAAEELRKQGSEDIGLLFTVDEERSSRGAKAANKHPIAAKCEFL